MLGGRLSRLLNDPFALFVAAEIVLVSLVAVVVFGFLIAHYSRTAAAAAAQSVSLPTVVAEIAPPTPEPSETPTSTPSPIPSNTPPIVLAGNDDLAITITPAPTVTKTPRPSIVSSVGITPAGRPTVPALVPVSPPRITAPGPWRAIDRCLTLDTPGNYRLASNLVTTGDCIKIQTSNLVLDCDGHSIQGAGFGGSGVSVRKYGVLLGTAPSNVEIVNCQLSKFRFGIYVEAGKRLSIRNNNSSGNFDDTDSRRYGIFLGMTDGGGIRVNSASESIIAGNVTKNQAIGIDVRDSNAMAITGNTSSENTAWGINLFGTVDSNVSSNVTSDNVRRCTWGNGTVGEGCDAGGIVLQGGSSRNVVKSNTVTGRNGNGIFIKAHGQPCGDNNSIIDNTITSVMYNSIELSFCSGNRISGNTIRDGMDAIWLGYSRNSEIRFNSISGMQNHGIISSNSHDNVISDNVITNSNEAIYFYSESFDRTVFYWLPKDGDYSSHHNWLSSNTIQSNLAVGIRLKDSTNNQVTGNVFQWNGRSIIVQGNGFGNVLQPNQGGMAPASRQEEIALRR